MAPAPKLEGDPAGDMTPGLEPCIVANGAQGESKATSAEEAHQV